MRRKKSQRILDSVEYIFCYGLFIILSMLPRDAYPRVADVICYLSCLSMSLKKKIRKNIIAAYGNSLSPRERTLLIKRILKKNIFFITEFVLWAKLKPEDSLKLIEFRNLESLKKVCDAKKPVVLITGHIGNFSIMIASLVYSGIPLTILIRGTNNQYLERFIDRKLRKKGIPEIKKTNTRDIIHQSSEWLRKGNALCILIDQHSGKGTKVEFFKKTVQAPTGAAVFARKYDACVFGAFISHKQGFRHRISIEGPYNTIKTNNAEYDFQVNTQLFYDRIEHYIRESPEEWFTWLHKRFR